MRAIKQVVTVQPGGRVEITSDQLPEGQQAEVIVLGDFSAAEASSEERDRSVRPIWEVAEELMRDVPEDEVAMLPTDLAAEHDHYLYGSPKRYS